uniref:Putative secreted protein n=1 Tax=Anopheles darlingi TaxID=43151 RepID=A0A2M4DR00_ANODA
MLAKIMMMLLATMLAVAVMMVVVMATATVVSLKTMIAGSRTLADTSGGWLSVGRDASSFADAMRHRMAPGPPLAAFLRNALR